HADRARPLHRDVFAHAGDHRRGRRHHAAARGHAGAQQRLPPPGAAGARGRAGGRAERRAAAARARRRLHEVGVRAGRADVRSRRRARGPAGRGGRLGEAVAILKGLLRGDTVTFAGQHYRVTGHAIHPRPRQQPHPPILIGGNGRQILTLAVREADIVALTGVTFSQGGTGRDFSGFTAAGTDERLRWIREAAGERFARL